MKRRAPVVALLQARDDEVDRRREYDAFLRVSGLEAKSLPSIDVTHDGIRDGVLNGIDAVIIGGSVWAPFEPEMPGLSALRDVLTTARGWRLPMLGVCFGAQMLAHHFGGRVVRDPQRHELGTYTVRLDGKAHLDPLFTNLPRTFPVQHAHRDHIVALPPGAELLATSERCRIQAFRMPGCGIYGVQFHPERSKADLDYALRHIPQRNYCSADVNAALGRLGESVESERVVSGFIEHVVHTS